MVLRKYILKHNITNTFVSIQYYTIIFCTRALGAFLCIRTPNTGQLNPLFHTFAEFRPIVNRVVARQSIDWLAGNAHFSPHENYVVIFPVHCTWLKLTSSWKICEYQRHP